MKRIAGLIKLKPGASKEEYIRRHDEIWPELSDLITRRGIRNYSIWVYENYLFSYFETDDDGVRALDTKEDILLDRRWAEYMDDMIESVIDVGTGEPIVLECAFLHE